MTALLESFETKTLKGDDLPWATFMPGIDVKVLRACYVTNSYTILSRFEAGIVLPRHKHFGDVQAYTLAGRWHYKEYDWVASPGSFVYEPPGAVHTLEVLPDSPEPALILFVVTAGMALLDDADQVWMLEDAPSMVERYKENLRLNGVEPPLVLGVDG